MRLCTVYLKVLLTAIRSPPTSPTMLTRSLRSLRCPAAAARSFARADGPGRRLRRRLRLRRRARAPVLGEDRHEHGRAAGRNRRRRPGLENRMSRRPSSSAAAWVEKRGTAENPPHSVHDGLPRCRHGAVPRRWISGSMCCRCHHAAPTRLSFHPQQGLPRSLWPPTRPPINTRATHFFDHNHRFNNLCRAPVW